MWGKGCAVHAGGMGQWQGARERIDAAADAAGFHGQVVIRAGGVEQVFGSYGLANRTHRVAVTQETRFGVASFCKMFTAVTVAGLVGEGRLGFDTSVREVLPGDVGLAWLRDDVTVGHLLSHTSGVPDYLREDELEDDEADLFTPVMNGRPIYDLRTTRDFLPLLEGLSDLAPFKEPPREFAYSSTGFVLAGLVVEELTGLEFTEAVRTRLLEPLGLDRTGYPALDGLEPDLAEGYLPVAGGEGELRSNVYCLPPVGGPDGGAFMNAADMVTFLEAYGRDEIVPGLRDVLLEPRAKLDEDAGYGPDAHYGYGVYTITDPGPAGRDGAWRFGHGGFDPGFECWAFRWHDQDLTAAITSNVNGVLGPVCGAVKDLVAASLVE